MFLTEASDRLELEGGFRAQTPHPALPLALTLALALALALALTLALPALPALPPPALPLNIHFETNLGPFSSQFCVIFCNFPQNWKSG